MEPEQYDYENDNADSYDEEDWYYQKIQDEEADSEKDWLEEYDDEDYYEPNKEI